MSTLRGTLDRPFAWWLLAAVLASAGCATRWRNARDAAGPSETVTDHDALRSRAVAAARPPRTAASVRAALADYRSLVASDHADADDLVAAADLAAWLAQREPESNTAHEHARLGVELAREAVKRRADHAPTHAVLARCLGLFAKDDGAGGLAHVEPMVAHAKRAIELDPGPSSAEPRRLLARVYAQAPSWPTSVGDLDLALEHARAAVALAPSHPEGLVALADALARDGDDEGARAAATRALAALAAADAPGDGWERDRWREEATKLAAK